MGSDETPKDAAHDLISVPDATLVGISISAELYARASAICEMRKCTLEAVIEDLIQRFLPRPSLEEPQDESMTAAAQPTPAKRRRMLWRRPASHDLANSGP